jgi:hypothetical protein
LRFIGLERISRERYYSDGNSLYSSTLTNPHRPRVGGVFHGHLLSGQLLLAGKAAECQGFAVIDHCQQAHGNHGKECRGKQPENVSGQIGHSTILSFIHPKTGQPAAMDTRNIGRSGTAMPTTALMLSGTSAGRRPRRRRRRLCAGCRWRAPGRDPVSKRNPLDHAGSRAGHGRLSTFESQGYRRQAASPVRAPVRRPACGPSDAMGCVRNTPRHYPALIPPRRATDQRLIFVDMIPQEMAVIDPHLLPMPSRLARGNILTVTLGCAVRRF